jgi:hypothetical protein
VRRSDRSDGPEIEQRADVDVLEACGRGDEQAGAVRGREDQRLRPLLRDLAG